MENIQVVVLIAAVLAVNLVCANNDGCVHSVNETAGYITSPNYPNRYPTSKVCTWELQVNPGERVKLTFLDMFLEKNDACSADFVALYDGNTTNDPLLGKFCDYGTTPPAIFSTTRKMLVKFRTDGSVEDKGFLAFYVGEFNIRYLPGVTDIERNLTRLLINTRQAHPINKWGTQITKIAISLFLSDRDLFALDNRNYEEIAYELSLQLLSKIALKKIISTKDLALYINALTVACIDPRDFFGFDLVEELRMRANKSNNSHPFSMLTLCNAKEVMKLEDVLKLHEQYYANFRPVWTDAQAMVVMALSCIHSKSELNLNGSELYDMVSDLKAKQLENGTIGNWKTTALVLQALIAAGDYRTGFNVTAAANFLLVGNYSNINDIYYILPILNGMSLANITSDHCQTSFKTEGRNYHGNPNPLIQVQISVIAGDDLNYSRTWKIKISEDSSFYEVLENIGTLEPAFKVQYSISEGKPYIYGLANFLDNAEDGLFWFIYSRPVSSPENLELIDLSPVDIRVNETDEMVLWYRSGFWVNSDEEFSK